MKQPLCKLKKGFLVGLIILLVVVSSIDFAHAASLEDYIAVIKWGLTPNIVNEGEDDWVVMRDQVYSLWKSYSDCSSIAKFPISYDALSDLAAELNGDGYPCYLQYSRGLGVYVIIGSGPVTGLTGVSVKNLYLTNGQSGLICAEYNTDSLLSSIDATLTRLLNRTLKTVGDTSYTIADLEYNAWLQLKTMDTRLSTMQSDLSRLLSRTLRTDADGVQYTVADLGYHIWQQLKGTDTRLSAMQGKLGSVDDRLAAYFTVQGEVSSMEVLTTRLDAILENLQAVPGSGSCQHSYQQEMTQEAGCTLPGLLVSTCSLCNDSYSEIISPLGHDWICSEHQEETETENACDIYTCQRCGSSYHDYSGSGAPEDYSETSISKLLVLLFSRLGSFAGKLLSFVIGLFDRALGSVDRVLGSFNELAEQISGFGGEYPAWLSGFWGILPQELQLALTFAFVCMAMGIVGRKLVFS